MPRVPAKAAEVSGVKATRFVPEIANHVPHVQIEWQGKLTAQDVSRQLAAGDPAIAVSGGHNPELTLSVGLMQGDEHKIVAKRLAEVLG